MSWDNTADGGGAGIDAPANDFGGGFATDSGEAGDSGGFGGGGGRGGCFNCGEEG